MREMRTLLIYLTGAVCLVLGILASGQWASTKYHALLPMEAETHTTAVASKGELADEATSANNPLRQPIWIEPTRKYVYTPAHVASVKPDLAPVAVMPKPQWKQQGASQGYPHGKIAVKRARPTFAASGGSRRADASAGQAQQQLFILPLQHQAPN